MLPGSVFIDDDFVQRCIDAEVDCLIAARSGSRGADGAIPAALAPGPLQKLLPLRVIAVDSMRAGAQRLFRSDGEAHAITRWYEVIDSEIKPALYCDDGQGFWYQHKGHHYLNGHVPEAFLSRVLQTMLERRGVIVTPLPEGLRLRRRGPLQFVFNFSPDTRSVTRPRAQRILGEEQLNQGDYAVWTNE
jgi:beta-galactosidase